MKYFISIHTLILIVGCFLSAAEIQNLPLLEKNIFRLQQQLQEVEQQLERSRTEYSKRIVGIDSLKTNGSPEDDIQAELKEALRLTATIENLQEEYQQIEQLANETKQNLYAMYNIKIDSLLSLKEPTDNVVTAENRDVQVLILMQKRIRVMPNFFPLLFKPELLSQMDSVITGDTLRVLFRQDYLNSSLTDVQERLSKLDKIEQEVHQQRLLEEQRESFLDDVESQSFLFAPQATYSSASATDRMVTDEGSYEVFADRKMLQTTPEINQLFDYINDFTNPGRIDYLSGDQLDGFENAIKKSKEYLALYRKLLIESLNSAQFKK